LGLSIIDMHRYMSWGFSFLAMTIYHLRISGDFLLSILHSVAPRRSRKSLAFGERTSFILLLLGGVLIRFVM
jgi:hypothetical protein